MKKQVSIYLTINLLQEAKIQAIKNGIKFSTYIEDLIKKDFKEREEESKEESDCFCQGCEEIIYDDDYLYCEHCDSYYCNNCMYDETTCLNCYEEYLNEEE